MAQKVQVMLVDDVDGGDAEETVTFGLDGATYEIDLSSNNAQELRDVLAPYVNAGRKVSGRRRRGRGAASGGGRGRGGRSAAQSATTAEIRQWARENGWDIPDRGRIAQEVREAYAAAH